MEKSQLNRIINISIHKNMKYGTVINQLLLKGIKSIIKNDKFKLPLKHQGNKISTFKRTFDNMKEERNFICNNYTKQVNSIGEIILEEGLKKYCNNDYKF